MIGSRKLGDTLRFRLVIEEGRCVATRHGQVLVSDTFVFLLLHQFRHMHLS